MKNIIALGALLISTIWLAFQFDTRDPATTFLDALSDEQRAKAVYDFNADSREFWSYLPGASTPRAGIQLSELAEEQKQLAFELLQSSLSAKGFSKAERIMTLESVLAEIDNNPEYRDPEKYYIAFYGDPESDKIWSWSFEGHHLSLNFTNVNGKLTVAPRFMGASPAKILSGPREGERTLAAEADLGLELIRSLSPEQRSQAIFSEKAYRDIVSGNAIEVSPLEPVGIAYGDLAQSQQDILNRLIEEYVSTLPAKLAEQRMQNIREEDMLEIHFGWAGPLEDEVAHYYRVQGKTFLIEFDHTSNNWNHVHTVWRDFDGDFGRDLIKEHYMNSDHH